MVQKSLAAELQERAARAVPAEFGERVGGWWLRHAPGCSWWIGSVLPHGGHEASQAELEALIAAAEAYTAERGIPTLLQMTPEAVPPRLDALLAARGYERQVPVSLQTATTSEVLALAQRGSERGPERGSLRVRLDKHPTREWFEAWSAVVGGDPEPRWRLLQRITEAGAYASVELGDETVAVGRAVAEDGWAGVFNMATRPEARGKGAAGAVIAALADWAAVNDAARMYLQVEQENEGAVRLYARVGFSEMFPFYFRVKE
ncbi:GNAT family N-acetyltransferase [Catenulispora sp. NF23]|uniref:GNAT family N-acetyltransferase n=1 Tax=Catenulispora pinistramenti TaxID=2705254 RepID=UPI001BA7DB7A|nr:GNAT family N-acetyltransferase [Catenulispora pinistramenti]MBS2538716.1 GNAT family N-acetyltransferase [Catenulispora pinistramenti]